MMKALLNRSKKAQAGTLQAIIVTLIIIGIVLGVGFLVLQEFKDTMGTTVGTSATANETITMLDLEAGGVYTLANKSGINCFNSFVLTNAENDTNFATINVDGNFSYDTNTGQIWNTSVNDPVFLGEGTLNVTYTYKYSATEGCDAIEETVDAVETIPTWLTIIVILVIVGVLLFIVFKLFPGGGENSHESSGSSGGFFKGFGSSSSTAEM